MSETLILEQFPKLDKLVRALRPGENVVVTRHGEPVAVIRKVGPKSRTPRFTREVFEKLQARKHMLPLAEGEEQLIVDRWRHGSES